MIFDAFFDFFMGLITWVIAWFPVTGLELPPCGSDGWGGSYLWVGAWFDFGMLRVCIASFLSIETLIKIPQIILFLYKLLPLT